MKLKETNVTSMYLKIIAAAALIALAPLPASAHGFGPPAIAAGIIGGILGGITAASGSPPPAYYPPPLYPPPIIYPAYPAQPLPNTTVAWIQHALNVLAGAGLVEDGVMGPATDEAIQSYQLSNGFVRTPMYVAPAMMELMANRLAQAPHPEG